MNMELALLVWWLTITAVTCEHIDVDKIELPKEWFDVNNMEISPNAMRYRTTSPDATRSQHAADPSQSPQSHCKRGGTSTVVEHTSTANFYINRFINIFLKNSGMQDLDLKMEEVRKILVEIEITGKQIEELREAQKFKSVNDKLASVDAILSKIFKIKKPSLFETTSEWFIWKWVKSSFVLVRSKLQSSDALYFYCVLASIVFYFTCSKNIFNNILFLLNSLAFIDSLKMYWNLQDEKEAENYWNMKRLETADCNPNNLSWTDSLLRIVGVDVCKERYVHSVKKVDVSFPKCLLETYLHLFVEYPTKHVGSAANEFIKKVSGSFSWPFNIIAYCVFIGLFITVLLPTLLSMIFGKKIRISSLFGYFELGGGQHFNEDRVQDLSKAQQQQIIMPPVNISLTFNSTESAKTIQLVRNDSVVETYETVSSQVEVTEVIEPPTLAVKAKEHETEEETSSSSSSPTKLEQVRDSVLLLDLELQNTSSNEDVHDNMQKIRELLDDLKNVVSLQT